MSFRFQASSGVWVECDTLEELQAAVGIVGEGIPVLSMPQKPLKPSKYSEDVRQAQREAVKKSWEAAEKYAKERGISTNEARSILAREKREAVEKALGLVD